MFEKIQYADLNARQQENYNFQKVAGKLADYGYNCLRLNDDWQGADFLACHVGGEAILRVQLKGRLTLQKIYCDKSIHIAFLDGNDCYVYPHDTVLDAVAKSDRVVNSRSWIEDGKYSWPSVPKWAAALLNEYKI